MWLHFFASIWAKETDHQNGVKSRKRLLTVIRRSVILEFAKTREGLLELCFGGLFLLSLISCENSAYAYAFKTALMNWSGIPDRDREAGSAQIQRTLEIFADQS